MHATVNAGVMAHLPIAALTGAQLPKAGILGAGGDHAHDGGSSWHAGHDWYLRQGCGARGCLWRREQGAGSAVLL